MSEIQDVEITELHGKITHDVKKLVEKYRKIFDWDVPDNDEAQADRLILKEIRAVLDSIETGSV